MLLGQTDDLGSEQSYSLIDKGVSVKTVQTIMRHSTVEMTLKYYTHQLIGGVEAAVNLFENIEKQTKKRKRAS